MSESDFIPPVDPQYIPSEAELKAKMEAKLSATGEEKFSQPKTGLAESIKQKAEKEKQRLKAILEASKKAEKPAITEEVPGGFIRQAAPPPPQPNPVKFPEIPAVNKEHEPRKLEWVAVQEPVVLALETISDVSMTLAAARQQRGVSFGLVSPKRGTAAFVKFTEDGTLMMTKPEMDPKAWANPGLNFDGDADKSENSTASNFVPNTRNTEGWPYLDRGAYALENKEGKNADLFEMVDASIEKELSEGYGSKVNVADINNPHQKALVSKLLNMADSIRNGGPLKDDKEELPPTKNTGVLMEEKEEVKEDHVDLDQLSRLAIQVSSLRKEHDSEQLENLEDELLNFIAESLLLGVTKVNSKIFEGFIEQVSDIMEG